MHEYAHYVHRFSNSKLLDDTKEACGKGYHSYYPIYISHIDTLTQ